MIKHFISNFALINSNGVWSKVNHCTTYTDVSVDVIEFTTEDDLKKYVVDHEIVLVDECSELN